MRRLAERSGGHARTSFDDIWNELPSVRTYVPLAPWIYLAAAFAFLAAVFLRRLGATGRWHLKLPHRTHAAKKAPPAKREEPKAPERTQGRI
jgi:hypothetical protein